MADTDASCYIHVKYIFLISRHWLYYINIIFSYYLLDTCASHVTIENFSHPNWTHHTPHVGPTRRMFLEADSVEGLWSKKIAIWRAFFTRPYRTHPLYPLGPHSHREKKIPSLAQMSSRPASSSTVGSTFSSAAACVGGGATVASAHGGHEEEQNSVRFREDLVTADGRNETEAPIRALKEVSAERDDRPIGHRPSHS
jgi:hypothetical protein